MSTEERIALFNEAIIIFCRAAMMFIILGCIGSWTHVHADTDPQNAVFDCNKPGDNPVTCLACNIYFEARGEREPGMWLVVHATKNRVDGNLYPWDNAGPKVAAEGFEDQYCKVVYEQRMDKRTK